MSEMLERVAKAINESEGVWAVVQPWEYDLARVAIKAMREPTEAMKKAAQGPARTINIEHFESVWRKMIDAALEAEE